MNKEHHIHETKHKKNYKIKKKNNFLLFIGIILTVIILILSYFGFIPFLSDLIGPKPINLGIKYKEEDYKSASAKLGRERDIISSSSPETSLKFEGSHKVNTEFSSEEITATMQTRKYKYNPITKFQAKITENKIEMSGKLMITNLKGYGRAIKIPEKEADEIMSKIGIIKINPSFYLKGTGEIINNELSFKTEKFKIGRISISDDLLPKKYISRIVKERLENLPGLNVESLKIENGKLKFKGDYPDKTYYDTG